MHKTNRFATFLSLVITSGLLILPTNVQKMGQEKLSDTNHEIASISNLDNYNFLDVSPNNNSADDLKKIIGIMGLTCGSGVIAYQLLRTNKYTFSNSWHSGNKDALLLNRVSPKLRQKLLSLVHNQQTANRLLKGTMLNHGNRSPNWLAEKVIYDLERDRY